MSQKQLEVYETNFNKKLTNSNILSSSFSKNDLLLINSIYKENENKKNLVKDLIKLRSIKINL